MRKHLLFISSFLLIIITGCAENASDQVVNKQLKVKLNKKKALIGDTVLFTVLEKPEGTDSLSFQGIQPVGTTQDGSYKFVFTSAGSKSVVLSAFKGEKLGTGRANLRVTPANKAVEKQFKLVKTWDHDPTSYTQGLELKDNIVYESKGQYGQSAIRKYTLRSSEIPKETLLPTNHFGEGLTIIGDSIYQLTWKVGICYLYDLELNRIGSYTTPTGEGWGLCHNGDKIYLTDGSHRIQELDRNFQIRKTREIFNGGNKLGSLNELEYANGKIYANVYHSNSIYIINPQTGAAEYFVDLSALRNSLTNPRAEVLNGIAYNASNNTFLVTGKYWDKMFEIEILGE